MEIEKAFSGLLVEPGRHLNLTVRGRNFSGFLVGFKPREYLVIEVPRSSEIDTLLSESHDVTGLFCTSGTMVRFKSSLVTFVRKPAWILLVAYPATLEKTHELRSIPRKECNIPCTLVTLLNFNQYTGTIVDISADGCKCVLSSISSIQLKTLDADRKILLEFELEGSQDRKRLLGEVANVKREGTKTLLGIKFDTGDETDSKYLSTLS